MKIPCQVYALLLVAVGLGVKVLAVHMGQCAASADLVKDGSMLFAAGLLAYQHPIKPAPPANEPKS